MAMHRRQFIIGPVPVLPDPDWTYLALSPSIYLSHSLKLPLTLTRDRDGVPWYLLGLAVQTDPMRPDPAEEISACRTSEVPTLDANWAGRWALIGNNRLYTDVTGMLSCFFRIIDSNKEHNSVWVSSSAVLLTELPGTPPLSPNKLKPKKIGLDWLPPPMIRFSDIYRLLPSQVIDLNNGSLFPRRLLPKIESYDYPRQLEILQQRLVTAITRAAEKYNTIWVPLTSGYDSRLFLASALYAGVKVKVFTQEYDDMAEGDRNIPPLLAQRAGIEHLWVAKGPPSPEKLCLYDAHTGEQVKEADRLFFAQGQWDWLKEGDLILRENALALGRCFMWKRYRQSRPKGELPTLKELADGYHESINSPLIAGFKMWLDWAATSAPEEMDWRDRFHMELRMAGWQGAIEQSLDLTNGERFFAANAGYIIALLSGISIDKRKMSVHHIDLIRRMAPELAELPFNPPDPLYLRTRRMLKKIYEIDSFYALGKRIKKKIKQKWFQKNL